MDIPCGPASFVSREVSTTGLDAADRRLIKNGEDWANCSEISENAGE
jgi:hypothetical protein